jgi:hypothetical protein
MHGIVFMLSCFYFLAWKEKYTSDMQYITQEVPFFMNCTSCSNLLPAGVAFCPTCGTPTPYNMPGQASASPYGQTEASSPYGNPNSPAYPALPPTIAANADGYAPQPPPPYTAYGAYSAGTPQPAPYNPYNMPESAYPGGAPPSPANSMGSTPYYGQSPMPGYQPGYQSGMPQPGMYGTLPKKRNKVGLIIGISLLSVVLLCGGVLVAAAQIGKGAANKLVSSIDATATANAGNAPATSNPSSNSGIPTSASIVPAAAQILSGAQTSSSVDSNYNPTNVTTTFATNSDVDLTFQIDSAGQNGYIQVKWYEDGQQVYTDILPHKAANNQGYFGETYLVAGAGAATLSWCTKADCSDAQLAQIVTFTISSTATLPSSNNALAVTDQKRNTF